MKIIGLIPALIWTASCGSIGPADSGRPVRDAYGGSDSLRIHERPSPLRAKKKIPVLSAPEVFAVYVPTHIDRERDLMIGEHWVFFKLRDAEWFVERESDPTPKVSGKADANDLAPLREIGTETWQRILVPHK